jgi:hypothetical protein
MLWYVPEFLFDSRKYGFISHFPLRYFAIYCANAPWFDIFRYFPFLPIEFCRSSILLYLQHPFLFPSRLRLVRTDLENTPHLPPQYCPITILWFPLIPPNIGIARPPFVDICPFLLYPSITHICFAAIRMHNIPNTHFIGFSFVSFRPFSTLLPPGRSCNLSIRDSPIVPPFLLSPNTISIHSIMLV